MLNFFYFLRNITFGMLRFGLLKFWQILIDIVKLLFESICFSITYYHFARWRETKMTEN